MHWILAGLTPFWGSLWQVSKKQLFLCSILKICHTFLVALAFFCSKSAILERNIFWNILFSVALVYYCQIVGKFLTSFVLVHIKIWQIHWQMWVSVANIGGYHSTKWWQKISMINRYINSVIFKDKVHNSQSPDVKKIS